MSSKFEMWTQQHLKELESRKEDAAMRKDLARKDAIEDLKTFYANQDQINSKRKEQNEAEQKRCSTPKDISSFNWSEVKELIKAASKSPTMIEGSCLDKEALDRMNKLLSAK